MKNIILYILIISYSASFSQRQVYPEPFRPLTEEEIEKSKKRKNLVPYYLDLNRVEGDCETHFDYRLRLKCKQKLESYRKMYSSLFGCVFNSDSIVTEKEINLMRKNILNSISKDPSLYQEDSILNKIARLEITDLHLFGDFSNDSLEYIFLQYAKYWKNLESLHLRNLRMLEFPKFQNVKNLSIIINLSKYNPDSVNYSFTELPNVEYLMLEIMGDWSNQSGIESTNRFKLFEEISNLNKLKKIYIDSYSVELEFPESFCELENLEVLVICFRDDVIKSDKNFHNCIPQLPKLKILYSSCSSKAFDLDALTCCFDQMDSLKGIYGAYSKRFHEGIYELKNLTYMSLSLEKLRLRDIDAERLNNMKNLAHMSIYYRKKWYHFPWKTKYIKNQLAKKLDEDLELNIQASKFK